jgi:hypothetical protein
VSRPSRNGFDPFTAGLVLLLAALLVFGAAAACSAPAQAAKQPLFQHPVKRGSVGKQVLAFKWIASGHDPSHYRSLIHYRLPKGDQCGRRCVKVILDIRWLLGEPQKYDPRCKCRPAKRPRFTREMYLILTGAKKRPLGWIGRENARLAIIHAKIRAQSRAEATSCAQLLVKNARHELALGVHEIPSGSNSGPRVRLYQAATTYGRGGRSYFPWCMAWVNFIARETGITASGHLGSPFHLTGANMFTPGPIAYGTACVFCAFNWAQRLGWLRARPVVGAIVLYMTNQGHTELVVGVTSSGFQTIGGNTTTDYGGKVAFHSYPFGFRRPVFLVLPCVQGARA